MKLIYRSRLKQLAASALVIVFLCLGLAIFRSEVEAASSLSLILTKTNSWEEAGKTRSQFSATIKNIGSEPITGWEITIHVPEDSAMGTSDGWNGNFSISGTILTITPKEYNSKIASGGQTADIGFILTSPGTADLTGSASAMTTDNTPDTPSGTTASTSSTTSESISTSTSTSSVLQNTDHSLAPTQDDWLHTSGNKILDQNNTEVWLTGINWFGYNTGTNIFDGVWSCNMNDALASIANHGFNLLRIPISAELVLNWQKGTFPIANFNQSTNSELVGKNSLEIFDSAIAACKVNGIKVMLDIHSAKTDPMGHMTNLWYTDTISTQDYYDSLIFLAKRFADDDTVVAYDLKNEPHGKPDENGAIWNDSSSQVNWKNTAETAGNLVLDINPHALIMIEGIEIYPKDISENRDFSSENSADYFWAWWGGNLRGVRDFPIDFGSEARNAQIVYSPHDYGPAVYRQPWFHDGYSFESLKTEYWNDSWLFINTDKIAPLLIGEWGGYMTEPNLTWMTYMRKLILENHLSHTFWCFNANSGDTGGLIKDDFTTWDETKYAFVKDVLWQKDGKFVGLDHVIPLGFSGNGLNLSLVSGPIDSSSNVDESLSVPTPIPTLASTTVPTSVPSGEPAQILEKSPSTTLLIVSSLVIILVGSGVVGYVTYIKKKKKGENK